jgi:hypothetical protein
MPGLINSQIDLSLLRHKRCYHQRSGNTFKNSNFCLKPTQDSEENHLHSWVSTSPSIPENKTSIITHATELLCALSQKEKEK